MNQEYEIKRTSVISASCFGEFKVFQTNTNLELKWRTKKAKELFAYFIHLQGKPVGRSELILRLWPESYPENAVKLLHNLIYSIRKEMENYGEFQLIQYKDNKYNMNMEYIDTDLNDMLYLSKAIEKDNREIILKYQKLLENYKGTYLDNIDCDWSCDQREYFERIYIKGCKYLAEVNIKNEYYEKALIYLKNALKVDPFSESVMEYILRCYGKVKDLKNIRNYYKKYEDLLEKEFSIKPGNNLTKAYQESIQSSTL